MNIHTYLEQQKLKVFATRNSCEEAMKYALDLLNDSSTSAVTTALLCYHNTLLNDIQKELKRLEIPDHGT